MIEIILDKRQARSGWEPDTNTIIFGADINPQRAGHEISHARLRHSLATSLVGRLVAEKDAWMDALRRLPPEEIKVSEIDRDFSTYVDGVARVYGEGSQQYKVALNFRERILDYARERRKELR